MNRLQSIAAGLVVFIAILFGVAGVASAQSVKSGDTVTVARGEAVDSMLIAAGNSINIDGEVNGDVYCAGQNIAIVGTVRGDVFCAGQNIRIAGTVEGSVRVAGQNITLGGSINGSTTVAGQSLTTESDGTIQRDLLGGVQTLTLNGVLGRDVSLGAKTAQVNNQVGRNIKGNVENLSLSSNARVGGSIDITSSNSPAIAEGAQVAGDVNRKDPPRTEPKPQYAPFAFTFMTILYILVALLLVILALALLIPQVLHDASTRLIRQPGKVIGIGFLAGLIVPVLIVLLLVSIVGIPLAFLVILLWCVIGFLSGPFTAYALGRLLLRNSKNPLLIALLGGTILLMVYFVPLIGFIALIAAHITGTGMVINDAMHRLPKPDQRLNTKLR